MTDQPTPVLVDSHNHIVKPPRIASIGGRGVCRRMHQTGSA